MLCAAAVNPVMFMEDNRNAVAVLKNPTPVPDSKPDNFSTSLVWVVSGVTSLTKVQTLYLGLKMAVIVRLCAYVQSRVCNKREKATIEYCMLLCKGVAWYSFANCCAPH